MKRPLVSPSRIAHALTRTQDSPHEEVKTESRTHMVTAGQIANKLRKKIKQKPIEYPDLALLKKNKKGKKANKAKAKGKSKAKSKSSSKQAKQAKAKASTGSRPKTRSQSKAANQNASA